MSYGRRQVGEFGNASLNKVLKASSIDTIKSTTYNPLLRPLSKSA